MKELISEETFLAAVVDDDKAEMDYILNLLQNYFPNATFLTFSSISQMSAAKRSFLFSVIDINLGKENGIEAANQICGKAGFIIYYSHLTGEIRNAFSPNTIGYIFKTDSPEYIYSQLSNYNANYFAGDIPLKTERGICWFHYRNILMITSENRKTYIYTNSDAGPVRIIGKKLKDFLDLPNQQFIAVHESVLVNICHIAELRNSVSSLLLSNGREVQVSRRMKQDVRRAFLRKNTCLI